MEQCLQALGVPWRIFPYRWWAVPEEDRRAQGRRRRLARQALNLSCVGPVASYVAKERCALIATNTLTVNMGAKVAKLLGKTHLWFLHEQLKTFRFDREARSALRFMERSTHLFVANSQSTQKEYQSALAGAPIEVIYPVGTEDPKAHLRPLLVQDCLRCVVVGTLQPCKRQDEAIEAVARLGGSMSVDLRLVGGDKGSYAAALRAQSQRMGVAERISFVGAGGGCGGGDSGGGYVVGAFTGGGFRPINLGGDAIGDPGDRGGFGRQ